MSKAEAYQAAKARAQERCVACRQEKASKAMGGIKPCDGWAPHTCHGDLAIVKDAMLAVLEPFHTYLPEEGDIHDPECEACRMKAEIERLFSEGGKE